MKKICLALVVLLIAVIVPVVSADEIVNETYEIQSDASIMHSTPSAGSTAYSHDWVNKIRFVDIERYTNVYYVDIVAYPDDAGSWENNQFLPEGRYETIYTINDVTKPAVIWVSNRTNVLGSLISTKYTIFFEDWDITGLSGTHIVTLDKSLWYSFSTSMASAIFNDVMLYSAQKSTYPGIGAKYDFSVAATTNWKNALRVTDDNYMYYITLQRVFDKHYGSKLYGRLNTTEVFTDFTADDYSTAIPKSHIDNIVISVGDQNFTALLTKSVSNPIDNTTVTVYVRNSQTGAAIANSRCVIDALVDGDYYPVVNRTEPSGIFSVTLQPTGGGIPNPDGYRLIASAEGYNNPMPEINFTVDEYTTSIYCYLDPIAGGPLDENNTFIDFFVRDMSANPISGATVKFGDYTLITNSQGYTVFEVDKSNTYTWTVSKSGYGSLTGNAVIGDDPRHTINTVLAPAVTPTIPTAIPTSTPISPTPTMTSPTGEPVSNWLEWFAAHFGMILGGGAEIGKIFMWLCFSVPVGVYVGKESKAGAAGFVAGAGIVTLFFVLIGWVPIWLLVLLALIIGLLYSKVFNNSDNGGGR